MVPGVQDLGVPRDGEVGRSTRLVLPDELRMQLAEIRQRKALVVLLVDLLDVSGSFLGRVRDLVGGNPIILVGTKVRSLSSSLCRAAEAFFFKFHDNYCNCSHISCYYC